MNWEFRIFKTLEQIQRRARVNESVEGKGFSVAGGDLRREAGKMKKI